MIDEPITTPDQVDLGGPQRLADFTTDGPAADTPAVTLVVDGLDVVVLRRAGDSMVDVYQTSQTSQTSGQNCGPNGGQITTLFADTQAIPISDPERRDNLIRHALRGLAQAHDTAAHRLQQGRDELTREQAEHERLLAEIRQYAIDRHVDNDICRPGLDKFLERFGFEAYRPRLRVHVRVVGTFEVDTEDQSEVEYQIQQFLGFDLSNVDHAVEHSDDLQVSITGIETVHD